MEILIGIMGSALFSWWITYIYYKKSLYQQTQESQEEIKKLLSILGNMQSNNRDAFLAKVLDECIEEYRRSGTPVRVLDSYESLNIEEKASLYDKVMLRVKGRLGKSNKYKNNISV